MVNSEPINIHANTTDSVIAKETLDDPFLNATKPICYNKKRPQSIYIFDDIKRNQETLKLSHQPLLKLDYLV